MRRPIVFAAVLMLAGCEDDQAAKAAESARIEREVARRVAVARKELARRESRWHAIRIMGFVVLTAGAVAGLMWSRQPRFPKQTRNTIAPLKARPPIWTDHQPHRSGRVIDLQQATPPPLPRPDRRPKSRQARRPRPPRQRRRNHENPRRC